MEQLQLLCRESEKKVKSLKKEMFRSNFALIFCVCIFMISNVLIFMESVRQYNVVLADYRQINDLSLINNSRKISFKLYLKSHEDVMLQQYYGQCSMLNERLDNLNDKMQRDKNCRMMYRIVCQVVEHRQEAAEVYIRPSLTYNPGILDYLDEADLEIERNLNLLMSHYLAYLNTEFEAYKQKLQMSSIMINIVLMTLCLLSLLMNRRMTVNIQQSIDRLYRAAQEITNKNLKAPDIEESRYIELNQVSRAFDEMKHTIRNMIQELNETHAMKERLAEAKIRELQMQMNPHFLFNTLSLVIRSIQLGERDTSIQLVKAISKILRSSIEIKTTAIPLDDEIELLQAYLYIQKLHLKGRVTFCLDVRKSFLDEEFMIPPLTIQPLVENSIQHGLKDRVSDGRVDILITERPDHMEVVVADNGVGFPKEEEKKDDTDSRQLSVPRTSIGLNNVRERLELYYRKEDVLQIERTDGITRVVLKLYKLDNKRESISGNTSENAMENTSGGDWNAASDAGR